MLGIYIFFFLTGKVADSGFRERIQCPKRREQYAFVTVWTQGHSAKLDDTLWVQVWGRGEKGARGEEVGIKTADKERRCVYGMDKIQMGSTDRDELRQNCLWGFGGQGRS